MRKIIATAAILAVTSAQAEELKFGDLNYFLKQGQFNVVADVTQAYQKETFQGNTMEARGVVLSTVLSYAINDQLSGFLGLNYAYDLENENKTTPKNADYTSDGLASPTLGANYRLLNQNTSRYNFDLGAVATIGIEDAEKGSSVVGDSVDGNYASPRNSLELNARIGRKWNESNEWQLAGGLVYFMDGESTTNGVGATADSDVDHHSSVDLFLKASYQYRPVNEFMLLVSAQATQHGESETESAGVTSTSDTHLDLDFRFTAKYLITDNFIAKFNYGISRNAEYDIETSGTSSELQKRRENFFGLGVDFLF